MNELATPTVSQLPALPTGDIKQMVDKVGAYVDALTAAKRAATDQNTINEIDDQIRKYSAFKIRCQMELGERTAKMETNITGRGDKVVRAPDDFKPTKAQQLSGLGISKQRASEYERLAKPENKSIVERYLERTEEEKRTPTTSGALKEIKEFDEPKKPHVTNNSGDNEWYTPAEYIEAARDVMGGIDLDPASNEYANQTVKAKQYFTEEMDGLKQNWSGHIWLNPPYSGDSIKDFVKKLISSAFTEAIVLVNNATETQWFRELATNADAILFKTGRIKFEKRDGAHGTPLQGQAFLYFGENTESFLRVFGKFGWGFRL